MKGRVGVRWGRLHLFPSPIEIQQVGHWVVAMVGASGRRSRERFGWSEGFVARWESLTRWMQQEKAACKNAFFVFR
jgi:hypothetical protein